MAGGFFLVVLIGGCLAYGWNRGDLELRTQEMQAVKKCEDGYRKDSEDTEVSFQDVTEKRFGSQIIVNGKVSYTGTNGQVRTETMNCN